MEKVVVAKKKPIKRISKPRVSKKIPQYSHDPYLLERCLVKLLCGLTLLVNYIKDRISVLKTQRLITKIKDTKPKDPGFYEE